MAIIPLDEFESIRFQHLYISELCLKEIQKLVKGSGIQKDFFLWLLSRFREIDDCHDFSYIMEFPKKYEKIGPYFNMTYRHKEKNIRILFFVEDNGNVNIFLAAMDEKKTSSDYHRIIKLADKRLKDEREF